MSQSDFTHSLSLQSSADRHSLVKEPPEFSLVLGGPLYLAWRRTHLSGERLELVRRRVIALTLLAWAPLLALSLAEDQAWSGSVQLTFFHDVELHARLLLALPLLIVGELFVYRRMRWVAALFLQRGLIADPARPQFETALASARRLRDSLTAEVLLIAFVFVVGVGFIWRTQLALDVTSWYGTPVKGRLQPSLAGWWLLCISLPLFQFLLLRWYFRLFIWARFLWHVSRIKLHLEPAHPDRCGGLGFLESASEAFAPLLLAQGTTLAGLMASRIFFQGADLLEFKVELAGLVAAVVFVILGPLLVFSPQLVAAKYTGKCEYGTLAMRYVREFDRKWLRGGTAPDEPLIGSADIQSLADLGNSFEVVKGMRFAPFTLYTALRLAVITLLPALPLTLTLFSLDQLLDKALNMIF